MNTILLIFFAIPILVIAISIALQKILKCPGLVASIVLAIGLVITFIVGNLIYLVAAIVYSIISFITAFIVCLICGKCNICKKMHETCSCNRCRESSNNLLSIQSCCSNGQNGRLLTISSNGCNGVTNDLLTINSNCSRQQNNSCCNNCSNLSSIVADGEIVMTNNLNDNNSNCNCQCSNSNNMVNARVNVIPNPNTNGRTGCICGNYRRR